MDFGFAAGKEEVRLGPSTLDEGVPSPATPHSIGRPKMDFGFAAGKEEVRLGPSTLDEGV